MSGKTSNESKRKYNEKAYDRIQLVVKKGKKEEIKACAEKHGYSLNSFVNEAIDEKMKRVGEYVPDETPNAETLEAFAELDNGGGHSFGGTTEQDDD